MQRLNGTKDDGAKFQHGLVADLNCKGRASIVSFLAFLALQNEQQAKFRFGTYQRGVQGRYYVKIWKIKPLDSNTKYLYHLLCLYLHLLWLEQLRPPVDHSLIPSQASWYE